MSITKEQWSKLEEEMKHQLVLITFSYKGYELSIGRVRVSESKTALAIYIDGVIKAEWFKWVNNIGMKPDVNDAYPFILKDICYVKTKAKYPREFITDMEKMLGKRKAKERFPDLHQRFEFYDLFYPKASVLCRKFKKLKGLELVNCIGANITEDEQ